MLITNYTHPHRKRTTMSAISIAEKKMGTLGPGPTVFAFLTFLTTRYEITDPTTEASAISVDDILTDEETTNFIKELGNSLKPEKKSKKKVSLTDDDRLGQYDGIRCDARIWKEKPKSGGLGYDNIQCSSKKADGCECLCKKHFKMQTEGNLWTGLITEPRSEEPTKPDGTRMFWSTDVDGNEIVKEKKVRKKSSEPKKKIARKPKKKSPEEMNFEELTKYMEELVIEKEKKEKVVEEEKDEEKVVEEEKDEEKVVEEEKEEEVVEEVVEEEKVVEEVVEEENEHVSDMPKPHPDGAFAKKEKEKKEKEKKEKEKKKKEKKEKEKKFDITTFEPEPENEDLDLDDEEESDEEEAYKLIDIDGEEFQINLDDNRVIRVDDFEDVGVWDPETESIEFDE